MFAFLWRVSIILKLYLAVIFLFMISFLSLVDAEFRQVKYIRRTTDNAESVRLFCIVSLRSFVSVSSGVMLLCGLVVVIV